MLATQSTMPINVQAQTLSPVTSQIDRYKSAATIRPVTKDGLVGVSPVKPLIPPKANYTENGDNVNTGDESRRNDEGNDAVVTNTQTDTNLSSWNTLSGLLTKYIDGTKAWSSSDIIDYSIFDNAYNDGKITREQREEGIIATKNYLNDLQAQKLYAQAMANAENEARRSTAYNDYLASKIASYLKEVQGTNGFEGYEGVTQGQAINLSNLEAQRQSEITGNKQTAQTNALEAYQKALLGNSEIAEDQRSTLYSSMDQQTDITDDGIRSTAQSKLQDVLNNSENNFIKQSEYDSVIKYINDSNVSDETKNKIVKDMELLYGDKVKSDEDLTAEKKSQLVTELNKITTATAFDDFVSQLTTEEKSLLSSEIESKNNALHPKGTGQLTGVTAKYVDPGYYEFTYNGVTYTSQERISKDPLGSDTGTFTYNEAEKWNIPLPTKASYKDILVVTKDGTDYFYVKRNGKWYYLCNSEEDPNAKADGYKSRTTKS